jgi:hypothetical protein
MRGNDIQTGSLEMMALIHSFINDILDRSARPSSQGVALPDLWTISILAFSGAATFFDAFTTLANRLFGIAGSIIPLGLVVVGLAWSIFVINTKDKQMLATVIVARTVPPSELTYAYSQSIRYLAKISMVVLLLLLPSHVAAVIDEFIPLPSTIYGYLVDARSRKPVIDAVVRVVDTNGVDVTTNQWPSDSTGFYIIENSRRVRRNSRIVVSQADCKTENELPMFRIYETRVDLSGNKIPRFLKPAFQHTINCGGTK